MADMETKADAAVEATVEATDAAVDAAAEQTEKAADHIQSSMDAASEGASQTFDALAPATAEQGSALTPNMELLQDLSVNTIYLMGSSFIVGVLFTVFILLVLDFMRRNNDETPKSGS